LAQAQLRNPPCNEYGRLDQGFTVALGASIVVAVGTIAYVVLTPRSGETFTEFYILGPGGRASSYPTKLTVKETGRVIIGVASHEAATVNYPVRVDLVGVQIVYNATAQANETVELKRRTRSWFNVTLANGANWTRLDTFSIPAEGLEVSLIRATHGHLSKAYQEVYLHVAVT